MCLYGMTAVSSQSVLALVMSLTETGNWCFVLEWCDVFYLNNTLLESDPQNRLVFSRSKTVTKLLQIKLSTCLSVTAHALVSFPEKKSLFYMGGTIVTTLFIRNIV